MVFSLVLLGACTFNNPNVFSKFYDLGDEGMVPDFEYVFQPFKEAPSDFVDSLALFKVFLELRYNESCKITEIPFNIEYGAISSDSITSSLFVVPLFDSVFCDSNYAKYGLYDSKIQIINSIPFDRSLFIAISSSESLSKGIVSLGVICEKL